MQTLPIEKRYDCTVIGAGPAGLLAGLALAKRGARVVVVAPEPHARWKPRYGVWADEVTDSLSEAVERTHLTPVVKTARGSVDLARPYAELSTPRLQQTVTDQFEALGGEFVAAKVHDIRCCGSYAAISTDGLTAGATARVVVDASGGNSAFTQRQRRPFGYQTAYGMLVEFAEPARDNRMTLMDWRPATKLASTDTPSFLYALPQFADRAQEPTGAETTRWFVEETVLVDREPHSFGELKERLLKRLNDSGNVVKAVLDQEHCVIKMGGGIPEGGQSVIPFGAAAGFVNPASGYQLAMSARLAPALAEAIVSGLDAGGRPEAERRAFAMLWPDWRRRSWEMLHFGMAALMNMEPRQIPNFIHAFFRIPTRDWKAYLSGNAHLGDLGQAMARLFLAVPLPLKASLIRQGMTSPLLRNALVPVRNQSSAALATGSL